MFWMGGLMALATALSQSGFIKWAAAFIANGIAGAHMGWISSFLIISLIYIYSHYCFASVTARISAMYAAFVAVAAACGAPALMVAVAFGIFANLPISLTHYGNGAVPVYFGTGYVSQSEWWRNGFIVCTVNTVVWLTVGMTWWKRQPSGLPSPASVGSAAPPWATTACSIRGCSWLPTPWRRR